jgi:superfamily II DNA or RNA helicase
LAIYMTKIIIKGNTSQITEESDANHILALDKHLSFYVQGAEHTAAFRGFFNKEGDFVKWDGFKKLLTPTLLFPTGLLDRVKDFYTDAGKAFDVVDKRPIKSIGKEISIIPNLEKMGKPPYPYQLEILDVIDKNDRGIIKVATGGGKSLIAALIAAKIGKRAIIYVIGKDLLYQFHDFFSKVFDEKIGIIGDGKCEIQNINIASIWTIGQALGMDKKSILMESEDDEESVSKNKYVDILKMMKETKTHIIDECHMSACETIQQVFKKITPEHLYGLSGSPWRDDGADLLIESILGKYIVNIPASRLINEGYLAKALIRFRVVPPYPYELDKNYQSIYKKYVVENDARNGLILDGAKTLVSKGYQTLVLFSSLKHGKILHELFEQHMKCAILDGSNSKEEREKVKKDLEERKIDCVLASKIFDIGVDIPSLAGLVIACGGKSTVKALQRVGRVIRKYPGKKFAVIIDFCDQATYLDNHSKIRYKIYKSEDGFDVSWPLKKKTKSKKKHEENNSQN